MKTCATIFVAAILTSGIAFAGDDNGGLNRDYWIPFSGNISAIQDKVVKNEAPTGSDILTSFEAVSWNKGKTKAHFADKYAQRVYGFIVPDESGEYVFWIAADDAGVLKLSKDDNPANAEEITKTAGWAGPNQFNKAPQQKSKPVKLEAGKKYFVEALMYEGTGGDNLSVAWTKPGQDQSKPTEVIQGKNLTPAKPAEKK
jgi:hypothetical protein